jgi:hypothetical protein
MSIVRSIQLESAVVVIEAAGAGEGAGDGGTSTTTLTSPKSVSKASVFLRIVIPEREGTGISLP